MSSAAAWGRNEPGTRQLYLAAWRWHFYAGIVVLPFLGLLAATGLVMLLSQPLGAWLNAGLYRVAPPPQAGPLAASRLLDAVRDVHPEARVVAYLPPAAADQSAQVAISAVHPDEAAGHGGHGPEPTLTVYVDPYQGTVLGTLDPAATVYAWTKGLHGTLLLGEAGDVIVEIVAGLALLLLLSGLYLAWPRDGGSWRARLGPGLPRHRDRNGWRDLHAAAGTWLALPLVFFLISGLAWTGVWGGRIVQAWSSIPAAELDAPASEHRHDSLNREPLNEMPWSLEQTPLPLVNASDPTTLSTFGIDQVVERARQLGFGRFRVQLPEDPASPWTLSASTMSGEVQDPRRDRTVHLNHAGEVVADLGFADYPLMGKAMAAGIPLHQGDLGAWNLVANGAFCLGVLLLCSAAVVSWWRRRPAGSRRLVPPPAPRDLAAWKTVLVIMLSASILVPLSAMALITVMVLDVLVVNAAPPLRRLIR